MLFRSALETYGEDQCLLFKPKARDDEPVKQKHVKLISQMHKAISIIQFKLEGQLIERNPEFKMDDRRLLHKINFERGTIDINGKEYLLRDTFLPTIDPKNPYKLTEDEKEVVETMKHYFSNSEKLRKHMRCIYANGPQIWSKTPIYFITDLSPLTKMALLKKLK